MIFVKVKNQNQFENFWIFTIFGVKNSNSERNQFTKITIIRWFLAQKFKFSILLIFLKIEFWDTIWDFLTVWHKKTRFLRLCWNNLFSVYCKKYSHKVDFFAKKSIFLLQGKKDSTPQNPTKNRFFNGEKKIVTMLKNSLLFKKSVFFVFLTIFNF